MRSRHSLRRSTIWSSNHLPAVKAGAVFVSVSEPQVFVLFLSNVLNAFYGNTLIELKPGLNETVYVKPPALCLHLIDAR